MERERIRVLIEQAKQAWLAADGEAFARLFAEDGLFIVPGQRWQGREAIRQAVEQFGENYSHIKIDLHQIAIDGERAVIEWTWEDFNKSTTKRTRAEDAIVVDFSNGAIRRWREYIDAETPKQPD
ncbi:SgcJ/EcaC family oxidoreductase [Gloeobacter morelensis]|uniref:SgcJ/EcaC family oxidoreductase n=1 Tax=Gloeobacter morelensis MG652769 TaxID=2781736 RepID=A0ABY3PS63_9CYAN|nr:SgcJ/EcaC family oxidoreductase [Gloeobacter morelensis]UFP96307.1 SgcJ/EcaC family oxidoreductase [Gloeobacter morelensis MG652769]